MKIHSRNLRRRWRGSGFCLLLMAVCLGACGKPEASRTDVPVKPPVETVKLEPGPDGLMRRAGDTAPFTGTERRGFTGKPWLVEESVPWADGRKHGTRVLYYQNGKPKQEIVWEQGKPKLSRLYSKEGALKAEMETGDDAEPQGRHKRFHPNGKVMTENTLAKGGAITGVERNYDESGTLISEYRWDEGKLLEIISETEAGKLQREKEGIAAPQ